VTMAALKPDACGRRKCVVIGTMQIYALNVSITRFPKAMCIKNVTNKSKFANLATKIRRNHFIIDLVLYDCVQTS
jgi:hypothetical protein